MKLLSASQIRGWDQYTILHEPITSIDLMERAARACVHWLLQNEPFGAFYIFCGKGNNGGDGLAIARLLAEKNINVKVFIFNISSNASDDFNTNLERLRVINSVQVDFIDGNLKLPEIPLHSIIIDTLFGTGLNGPLTGLSALFITHLNQSKNKIISIDLPSGLLCDEPYLEFPAIKATYTLTFQCLKYALLIPENEIYFGEVSVLDIGLCPDYLNTIESRFELVDKNFIRSIYKPRRAFSHKGSFGHALLIAGSYGKMGAAVLCTRSCLRSGVGLVTTHIPKKGVEVLQSNAPEAMCAVDNHDDIVTGIVYEITPYASVGIGPGIGLDKATVSLLYQVITVYKQPLVIDADALNILSTHKDWLSFVPAGSILTPHPKEFGRLFGDNIDDFKKIDVALSKAREFNIIIVLKGHRTFIATPHGNGFFNTTGNAGMATGGSGDILTGLLTGLLAQGYEPAHAAILGVYMHGAAGDIVAKKYTMEAMIAGDLVEAFKELHL